MTFLFLFLFFALYSILQRKPNNRNAKKQDVTINYPKKTEKLAKTYYFNRTKMLDEQGLTAEIIKKRTERWNNQFGTVGVKDVRNLAEYDKQFQEYKGFKVCFLFLLFLLYHSYLYFSE